MTLASYCKVLGYSLEQFNAKSEEIENIADQIVQGIKLYFPEFVDSGMYYELYYIIPNDMDFKPYVIQALKKRGVEFIDDNTLWRY